MRLSHPITLGILFGLIVFILLSSLLFLPIYNFLELKAYDMLFLLRGARSAPANIVLVAIDGESLGWLAKWPWPRTYHARLVENLKAAGAAVIAFDVLFDAASSLDPRHDTAFAAAIKRSGNVVLASSLMEKTVPNTGKLKILQLPIAPYQKAAYSSGIVNPPRDADSSIRRYQSYVINDGEFYPSFARAVLACYAGWPLIPSPLRRSPESFGPAEFLINYRGSTAAFRTIPYDQVLDNSAIQREADIFKDKIVLIGATATELHDLFGTPFSLALPGVEIHANAIDNLLHQTFIKESPLWLWLALTLVLALVMGSLLFILPPQRSLAVALLLMAGYLTAVYGCFLARWWLPAVTPTLAVFFTYVAGTGYRFGKEEAEKRKIRGIFSKYVSDEVVAEILKDPEKGKLGGNKQVATIFFSDIRNFTAISETLDPEGLVQLLNEYFTVMSDIIFKYQGTLDKYIGDALMAAFGVPFARPDDPLRAVAAALEMMAALKGLRAKWTFAGKEAFDIGIGINTGEVVAGNIGSEKRLEYTVIGDSVNLAARLESLNKEFKTHILISEFTYALVKDRIEARFIDKVTVKGKSEAVGVWEVIELKKEAGLVIGNR